MKKIRYILPILMALISFLFYMMLYRPAFKSSATDFVTMIMTVSTVLGWSSMVLWLEAPQYNGYRIYLFLYILIPIPLWLWCQGFQPFLHGLAHLISLLISMIIWLYTRSYVKHTSKINEVTCDR